MMEPLNGMLQRWTVSVMQDVSPYLDDVVWSHTQEEPIESGVMQSTQREAVAYAGHALGLGVGGNMRRIEQPVSTQPAQRALAAVGPENSLSESTLV